MGRVVAAGGMVGPADDVGVVAGGGQGPDGQEHVAGERLRRLLARPRRHGYCGRQPARFKVPKVITFVDALPRNPSGTVLKRELRAT